MHRYLPPCLCALLLIPAGCASNAAAAPGKKAPRVVKTWTPPQSDLPKEFVEATDFLLKHGMADPRGGAFVEATVLKSTVWSPDPIELPILGWHLPKEGVVVGLDGLAWRPTKILGKRPETVEPTSPSAQKSFRVSMTYDARPIAAALMLVRGNVTLAKRALGPTRADSPIFLTLANAYLIARFERAVTAHMRGDDDLAASDARALADEKQAFRAEAIRVIGAKPLNPGVRERFPVPGAETQFTFLAPVEVLAADSERRLGRPRLTRPASDASVDDLIRALEEVDERQWGQPGGVALANHPTVRALVKHGEPAIEPLLKTMETDRRLTRSVSFGRDFFPTRNLISVRDAAYAAVRGILGVDNLPQDPAAIRAFWKSTQGLSQPERWMQVLADDKVEKRQYVEAAMRLMDPVDVARSGFSTWTPNRKPGEPSPPVKAEALRSRRNPSLSDLLAKRSLGFLEGNTHPFDVGYAIDLALYLNQWDAPASRPVLRQVFEAIRTMSQGSYGPGMESHLGEKTGRVVEALYRLGDRDVVAPWAEIIRKYDLTSGRDLPKALRPLVTLRQDPAVAEVADRLFRSPDATFNLAKAAESSPYTATAIAMSPLLALAPVQKSVDEILADRTVVGTATLEKGMIRFRTKRQEWGQGVSPEVGANLPKVGTTQPLWTADPLAVELTRLKGAPKYQAYWPAAKKARALEAIRAFLRKNVYNVEAILPWPENGKVVPDR